MKKKNFKMLCVVMVTFMMFLTFVGCGGSGGGTEAPPAGEAEAVEKETISLTVGSGHNAGAIAYTAVSVDYFQPEIAKRVAEETNYEIEWIEAYGGTVATVTEGLNACQTGLVDILVNTYSFETSRLFPMVISYYVPFSSADPFVVTKAMRDVINAYPGEYDKLWKTYNQKFLAYGPTGSYEIITNFPVDSLAKLNGHKIAAAGANLSWLQGTGAVPVQSNLGEAYTSLQTGVYEGWVMHAEASLGYKLHEVAPNFTILGYGAMPIQGISVNLDKWNSLPEEVRAIIEEVSLEYEIKCCEEVVTRTETSLKAMADAGVVIKEVADADKTAFASKLSNLSKQCADELDKLGYSGADIVNAFIESQEAQGHVFPRDWTVQ